MTANTPATLALTADRVHETLGRHILADGYDMVLDVDRSRGRRLWDARRGRGVLDMFSFFATAPLGLNHPKMADPVFREKLLRAALSNPTNSDIYTLEFAEFVETFGRVGIPSYLPYAFFVAGGTLGVENALKAAMDWKVRRNFRKGLTVEKGHQIVHFRDAFHGRSGYTMSLTNTADPRKYLYYSKFDWPRITNPALRFPVDGREVERVEALERQAVEEIKRAFVERQDDVAAIIIEPIQAEGGDNHYRPEFMRALRQLADENDALLIFDEVQSA
jgi:L-lysine 6-transaminase